MRLHRSLYVRFALGVVGLLAAMLVVQAILFTWAVSQSGRSLPGQSPLRFGQTIALDLANLLEREPKTDLAQYVHEQYAQYNHPFFVVLDDGRVISSGSAKMPDALLAMARGQLQRWAERPPMRRFGRGDAPRFGAAPPGEPPEPGDNTARGGVPFFGRGERFERGPGGMPFVRPAPIVVAGKVAGVVVVPPQAPFGFLLGRFAPMLALVAAAVLIVGTIATSALIFGPARRRLRGLEMAARRLGAGDLAARAPDRGGDEIAAVASAFNAMASDLSARADALAASDRARRQLLADVSHELTTPVTAMRGYLETLTMPELTIDAPTRARYLGIISDETNRLERLIRDLLELARLEGGGGTLAREPVAVADLFARAAARHERAAEAAKVAIETTVAPGAETVVGDRDRLEQAIQNLAANAVRYAPPGTAIRLAAQPHDGAVEITVADRGPGIPAEHLPHIFDRFYKADAAREGVSGGSGLGLSIVKAIVERHGGSISVESGPGRTAFTMRLPASRSN
ncbi:MAG: HAMP domain-containing protein [Acidobacteria bacterium]|nr:HAMP domain-containing protein [Acidobacteriota bacterium]